MSSTKTATKKRAPKLDENGNPIKRTRITGGPDFKEFVRAWEAAETLEDFCKATGMTSQNATARASQYRKRMKDAGKTKTLKQFRRGGGSKFDPDVVADLLGSDKE